MDKPERKIRQATREAERRAAEQRQRTDAVRASEVRRQQLSDASGRPEKTNIIDPQRQSQLDRISLIQSPVAEKRRRELSGRPLSAPEERLANESKKKWEAKWKKRLNEVHGKKE